MKPIHKNQGQEMKEFNQEQHTEIKESEGDKNYVT